MMGNEFEIEWYRQMWWLAEGVEALAKQAADACWKKKEDMLEFGFNKMEPDTELLVKLFLLLDVMDDKELREELEHLKKRFDDVYAIRHKPWLDTQWGMEDEDEEAR